MTGKEVLRRLRKRGCEVVRQKGSHVRMRCGDCQTTVPVHAGEDLPAGTLSAIERDLAACVGKGLAKVTTYRIHLERDENGTWIVRSPDVPGFHTYGRSLRQAKNRAREALSLWIEDADDAELEFQFHLPKQWREATREFRQARTRAINAEREAQALASDVANYLTVACGLSLRDAAELLGLSHQRVQQLIADYASHANQHKVRKERPDRLKRSEALASRARR